MNNEKWLGYVLLMLSVLLFLGQGSAVFAEEPVVLSVEEIDYIEKKHTVRMVVDPDWYPYERIGASGVHEGIAADILSLIAARTGLRFELVPTESWEESLEKAKAGHADVVSFLNKTEARSQWLLFSEPYYTDPNVVITREEHDYVADLQRLTGEVLVLPKGTSVEERLRTDYPNLEILLVDSEEEALAYVDRKKADMTLRSLTMAAYVIKKGGYFNLKIAGEVPAYTNYLRMGITQKDEVLLGIINKGIGSLSQQEIQAAINNHVSIRVMKGFDYKLFALMAGFFSIVLLSSFFWMRRIQSLNRRLTQRQEELVRLSEQLSISEALHQSVLNASPDAIILSDEKGNILMASPATLRIIGLEKNSDLQGMNLMDFVDGTERDRVVSNIQRRLAGEVFGQTLYKGFKRSGEAVVFEVNSEIIQDEHSRPSRFVSIIRDVTDRIRVAEALKESELRYRALSEELEQKNLELQQVASIDALTGLKNRHFFNQRILEEIQRAERYGSPLSMLLMDMDHFKRINDTYGHDVGDDVIRTISAALKGNLRQVDLISRWGGEEFVVLMPDIALEEAAEVGEKLRETVERLRHAGDETVTISGGVSAWSYLDTMETWFSRTDQALYHAKQEGRNRICVSQGPGYMPHHLSWVAAWESGNERIDTQHQALLQRCNDLIGATLGNARHVNPVGELEALLDVIRHHFQTEEEILTESGYENVTEHRVSHQRLLKKAERLLAKAAQGNLLPGDVLRFIVNDMVTAHLIEEDTQFFHLF